MARKKTTIVEEDTEETPITPTDENTNDDTPISYTDLHETPIEDIVRETPEEDTEEEIKPVVEEVPPTPEPTPPPIDQEKLKEEISTETTKKIVDALTGDSDKETKENSDEYEKWAKELFDKEGREPNWKEAAEFIKDKAKSELLAEQKAEYDTYQKQQSEAKEQEERAVAEFNREVDNELAELYQSNKLPKIKDENDPKDPGIVARQRLFQTTIDVNIKREQQYEQKAREVYAAEGRVPSRDELNLAPIKSIARIFTNYYTPPTAQPAGADAPIFNSRASQSSASDDQSYTYKDIKKSSWFDILRGK